METLVGTIEELALRLVEQLAANLGELRGKLLLRFLQLLELCLECFGPRLPLSLQ